MVGAMKRIALLGMLGMLGMVLTGCVAVVAAGAAGGGVAYVRGELQAQLDADVTRVNTAVERAGHDLQLHAITQERDKLGGKFTYRNAKDQKITITTKALTAETATVGIRVGVFGDQTQSMLILDRIRARLK